MDVVPDAAGVAPTPWAESFVELYRAERQPMVRLAFLLTGGDPAAEELVHDAFLRVHAGWDRIESPGAFFGILESDREPQGQAPRSDDHPR